MSNDEYSPSELGSEPSILQPSHPTAQVPSEEDDLDAQFDDAFDTFTEEYVVFVDEPPEPSPDSLRPGLQVARARQPLEWTNDAPRFDVPAWAPLGCQALSPQEMARHTLITGETGSGKTKSGIFPLVEAALRYPGTDGPRTLVPSILVIDPKHEIADFVARICAQAQLDRTIVHFDPVAGTHTLWYFEGVDSAHFTADEYVDRVFRTSGALETESEHGSSGFFKSQATGTLRQFVSVDIHIVRTHGYEALPDFWNLVCQYVARELDQPADQTIAFDEANYLAVHYALTNNAAASVGVESTSKRPGSVALHGYLDAAQQYSVPASLLIGLRSLATIHPDTFTSIVATVNNVLGEMSSPELARHVSFNPFTPPPDHRWLSVAEALDAGHVVIHHPRDSSRLATLVGKCLKTKFFEWTFARANQERPFVYVCDEFQRYITNDATSGEQSFLDRCRAYRAACVLATQSVASLEFALAQDRGSAQAADGAALEVLFNNTGNKLFFRNTDLRTQDRLRKLLPVPAVSGKPHVTEVRPVSTLQVGEAYFLRSNGAWGRRQIMLHD